MADLHAAMMLEDVQATLRKKRESDDASKQPASISYQANVDRAEITQTDVSSENDSVQLV